MTELSMASTSERAAARERSRWRAVATQVFAGTVAVALVAAAQSLAVRLQHIPPVNVIGLRQMAAGMAIVITTAVGVLA